MLSNFDLRVQPLGDRCRIFLKFPLDGRQVIDSTWLDQGIWPRSNLDYDRGRDVARLSLFGTIRGVDGEGPAKFKDQLFILSERIFFGRRVSWTGS